MKTFPHSLQVKVLFLLTPPTVEEGETAPEVGGAESAPGDKDVADDDAAPTEDAAAAAAAAAAIAVRLSPPPPPPALTCSGRMASCGDRCPPNRAAAAATAAAPSGIGGREATGRSGDKARPGEMLP